jgi:hypothetical protein
LCNIICESNLNTNARFEINERNSNKNKKKRKINQLNRDWAQTVSARPINASTASPVRADMWTLLVIRRHRARDLVASGKQVPPGSQTLHAHGNHLRQTCGPSSPVSSLLPFHLIASLIFVNLPADSVAVVVPSPQAIRPNPAEPCALNPSLFPPP